MISLDNVEKSILELEQRDTSMANCERLACLYIVRDNLRGYSVGEPGKVDLTASSDFLRTVNGRNVDAVWNIMDQLMDAIKALHPRMYDAVLEKIKEV